MHRVAREAARHIARAAATTATSQSPAQAELVQRALFGVLASTSPKTQAQLLAELHVRLRGAMPLSPLLPKAFSEFSQLHARQVAAVGRQMDAAGARIAQATLPHRQRVAAEVAAARQQLAMLQQRLGNQVDLFSTRLAPVLCNSLSISSTGQRLMLFGLPLTLSWWLSDPAYCHAPEVPVPPPSVAPPKRNSLILRAIDAVAEEVAMVCRALYLMLLFVPAASLAPLCIQLGWRREDWLLLLRWTLERAGPAFIKWGQWAATRPDMFPADLCRILAALQTGAPRHDFRHTRSIVEAAFRQPLEEMFTEFAQKPVASGSIAQIHRAVLSSRGAERTDQPAGTVVAVKVRHPGVSSTMQRDFALMQRAAALSARVPVLAKLNLQESVRQFGAPLREQLDLQAEARNLQRFNTNFRSWKRLSFPRPIFPLVASDVLVESFEEGKLISHYVDDPQNRHNVALADIGLSSYLQMLLRDNFIHADLHPGNILVRVDEGEREGWWAGWKRRAGLRPAEHVVLLDVGMVAELSREDQYNLVGFFKAITAKDGADLGRNILRFADEQTCPDTEVFVRQMAALFDRLTWDEIADDTSGVIQDIMEMVRVHQVSLRGVVSTVVVTTLVLEGWSSKLNPDLQMLQKLKELLPLTWPERIEAFAEAFGSDRPAGDNLLMAI